MAELNDIISQTGIQGDTVFIKKVSTTTAVSQTPVSNGILYCKSNGNQYKYITDGSSYTVDGANILETLSGGNTRWISIDYLINLQLQENKETVVLPFSTTITLDYIKSQSVGTLTQNTTFTAGAADSTKDGNQHFLKLQCNGYTPTFSGFDFLETQVSAIETASGNINVLCFFKLYEKFYYTIISKYATSSGDVTPPTITNVSTSDITGTSLTLNLTSSEDATLYWAVYADGSTSKTAGEIASGSGAVKYGNSSVIGNQSKAISILNLTSETAYDLRFFARDTASNDSDLQKVDVTTLDGVAPVLSLVSVSDITQTTANLNATSNEAATLYWAVYAASSTSKTNIEIQAGTGSIAFGNSSMTANTNTISQISLLTANTEYDIRYFAKDIYNNESVNALTTFTTLQVVDVTPPSLSSVGVNSISTTTATFTATSNEAATLYWALYATGSTSKSNAEIQAGTGSISHNNAVMTASVACSVNLTSLSSTTGYDVRYFAKDTANNESQNNISTFTTTSIPDTNPPSLSAISISNIATTSARFNATSDETATLYWALYATGSTSKTNAEIQAGTGAISHNTISMSAGVGSYANITSLTSNTGYDIRYFAKDTANNESTNALSTFTTLQIPQLSTPTNGTVIVNSSTSLTAVVSNVDTNSTYLKLEYKATSSGTWSVFSSTLPKTTTNQAVTGLTASTGYDFRWTAIGDGVNYLNSNASTTQSGTTSSQILQLNQPTNGSVTIDSTTSLTANVSNVDTNSTYLKLEYKATSSGTWLTYSSTLSKLITSQSVTGLTANTGYDFRWTCVGDGVNYSDSYVSTTQSGTTKNIAPTMGIPYTDTSGAIIELPFSRAMADPSSQSNLFTPSGGKTVSSVSLKSGDDTKIQVTLSSNYVLGDSVTTTIGSGLIPADGGLMYQGVSNQNVTNKVIYKASLSVNTTDNYLYSDLVTGLSSFVKASAFTLSSYVYITNITGVRTILSAANSSNQRSFVMYIDSGYPSFAMYSGGSISNSIAYNSNTQLSANSWVHIGITYSNGLCTIYINGTSVASTRTEAGTNTAEMVSATRLKIGSLHSSTGSTNFVGELNDSVIFNKQLSSLEIAKISSKVNGVAIDIMTTSLNSNIISYWRLSDATDQKTVNNLYQLGTPVYSTNTIM